MKLITAIVRPERLPAVKEALFKAGVRGITISRVSGHGGQAGHLGISYIEGYDQRRQGNAG